MFHTYFVLLVWPPESLEWPLDCLGWLFDCLKWPSDYLKCPFNCFEWLLDCLEWPPECLEWPSKCLEWPSKCLEWPFHCTVWSGRSTVWKDCPLFEVAAWRFGVDVRLFVCLFISWKAASLTVALEHQTQEHFEISEDFQKFPPVQYWLDWVAFVCYTFPSQISRYCLIW